MRVRAATTELPFESCCVSKGFGCLGIFMKTGYENAIRNQWKTEPCPPPGKVFRILEGFPRCQIFDSFWTGERSTKIQEKSAWPADRVPRPRHMGMPALPLCPGALCSFICIREEGRTKAVQETHMRETIYTPCARRKQKHKNLQEFVSKMGGPGP